MAIYAIVQSGVVVNTVEWDGATPWEGPLNTQIVHVPDGQSAGVGYAWNGSTFSAPASSAPVPIN